MPDHPADVVPREDAIRTLQGVAASVSQVGEQGLQWEDEIDKGQRGTKAKWGRGGEKNKRRVWPWRSGAKPA